MLLHPLLPEVGAYTSRPGSCGERRMETAFAPFTGAKTALDWYVHIYARNVSECKK